jgi:hypothetical protein
MTEADLDNPSWEVALSQAHGFAPAVRVVEFMRDNGGIPPDAYAFHETFDQDSLAMRWSKRRFDRKFCQVVTVLADGIVRIARIWFDVKDGYGFQQNNSVPIDAIEAIAAPLIIPLVVTPESAIMPPDIIKRMEQTPIPAKFPPEFA